MLTSPDLLGSYYNKRFNFGIDIPTNRKDGPRAALWLVAFRI